MAVSWPSKQFVKGLPKKAEGTEQKHSRRLQRAKFNGAYSKVSAHGIAAIGLLAPVELNHIKTRYSLGLLISFILPPPFFKDVFNVASHITIRECWD